MIKVHHLNHSRSQRVVWLLEELELPYEIVHHQRDTTTLRAPPSLFQIHPLGKGPTIEHDGIVLTESGAIIDYVTRRLAGGRLAVAEDATEFPAYLFWLHYAEGSAMPPVVFDMLDGLTGSACGEALRAFYLGELNASHDYMETALTHQDYLLPSGFSAADINLAWVLELSEPSGHLAKRPHLAGYLQRLRQRAAHRRSIERGGEQDLRLFVPSAG